MSTKEPRAKVTESDTVEVFGDGYESSCAVYKWSNGEGYTISLDSCKDGVSIPVMNVSLTHEQTDTLLSVLSVARM